MCGSWVSISLARGYRYKNSRPLGLAWERSHHTIAKIHFVGTSQTRGQRHLHVPMTSLCPAFHNRGEKCQGKFPVYLDVAGLGPSFSTILPIGTVLFGSPKFFFPLFYFKSRPHCLQSPSSRRYSEQESEPLFVQLTHQSLESLVRDSDFLCPFLPGFRPTEPTLNSCFPCLYWWPGKNLQPISLQAFHSWVRLPVSLLRPVGSASRVFHNRATRCL